MAAVPRSGGVEGEPRGPWSWHPSRRPWFDVLGKLSAAWCPDERLEVNRSRLRGRLTEACEAEEGWLLHPCSSVLTLPDSQSLQRDFQLAVWTAAHTPGRLSMGPAVLPEPLWVWAADGGSLVPPGRYDLGDLGVQVAATSSPTPVDLDVWCNSLGFPYANTWAEAEPATEEEGARLERDITNFLRTVALGHSVLPAVLTWSGSVVRVAVPLRRDGGSGFRSGSVKEIPGMVTLDIDVDAVFLLEALIHESAHHHLFLAEAESPLVDPDHNNRYHSPLRPEPRPLRGILLAYHALAYICALYADARRCGLMPDQSYRRDVDDTINKLEDAERTLLANRRFLTELGSDFLDRTAEVASYGHA